MFEVVEQDGNLSRIAHVSIIPVSPKHFMCLKHQKEGESSRQHDEAKKLPGDYIDSQNRELKFDDRQELKKEDTDESSSDENQEKQTNESLDNYKKMRHGLLNSL